MSLAAYLAKNYLTADQPERPKKKRKKTKHQDSTTEGGGLVIADDDPPDLRNATTSTSSRRGHHGRRFPGSIDDEDDEEEGYIVADDAPRTAGFRKSQSKWQTVEGPSKEQSQNTNTFTNTADDHDAADAILASAAAERDATAQHSEDAPVVADSVPDNDAAQEGPRMESGARAGLQTASQTAAMMEAQRSARKKDMSSMASRPSATESDTIYRDASGRIINVAMARSEARKAAEEKAKAEAAEKEAQTGDVQRRERESRKAALEEAKFMPLARGADDEEMNRELKGRRRWNDPAAEFLESARDDGAGTTGATSTREGEKNKKAYKGAAPPNRYGIRPGHRWDGVDRSTGFEQKWFEVRNKRERNESLSYAWQMDE